MMGTKLNTVVTLLGEAMMKQPYADYCFGPFVTAESDFQIQYLFAHIDRTIAVLVQFNPSAAPVVVTNMAQYEIAKREAGGAGEPLPWESCYSVQEIAAEKDPSSTPASRWRVKGRPDPHGNIYECERAALCQGHLTDDEIASAVYLDPSIGNLTAAKERIRWLSRKLVAATTSPGTVGKEGPATKE